MGNCTLFKYIYYNVQPLFSSTRTPENRTQETESPETKTLTQKIDEISKNNRYSNYSANVFPNMNHTKICQKVTQRPEILIHFLRLLFDERDFSNAIAIDIAIHNPNNIYRLYYLNEYCLEYRIISNLFMDTNKPCYRIQKIEKVFNPYLLLQYRLKYLEYESKKKNVMECMMFHGTMKANLDSICRNNFNWRLSGRNSGSRNGKGVNFVNNSYYCTHYGDPGFDKVMILAKVMISKCCQGSPTLIVPPGDIDTTTDHRQPPQVFVKFDDSSFYPAYIIYYGGIDPKHGELRI